MVMAEKKASSSMAEASVHVKPRELTKILTKGSWQ